MNNGGLGWAGNGSAGSVRRMRQPGANAPLVFGFLPGKPGISRQLTSARTARTTRLTVD